MKLVDAYEKRCIILRIRYVICIRPHLHVRKTIAGYWLVKLAQDLFRMIEQIKGKKWKKKSKTVHAFNQKSVNNAGGICFFPFVQSERIEQIVCTHV